MRRQTEKSVEFLRSGQAAKLLRMSRFSLGRKVRAGEIHAIYRNGKLLFPRSTTEAYARRIGIEAVEDSSIDALAFGMMREGASNETIVTQLQISLDRVLRLREHRDAGPGLGNAGADDEETERESKRLIASRQIALVETLERERAERRRKLTG